MRRVRHERRTDCVVLEGLPSLLGVERQAMSLKGPHDGVSHEPRADGQELSGMDAEDRAARALLAQYDIHLRTDEPLANQDLKENYLSG